MPDLLHTLHGVDLHYLHHVADKWGIPLDARDVRQGLPILTEEMTKPALVQEMVAALTSEARAGLKWLLERNGRALWDLFTRRFGEVREMGSARRERERPDLEPISPAEVLWYRAFISRGFFDTESGPREFVYIPDDLKPLLADILLPSKTGDEIHASVMLARKATPEERKMIQPATGSCIDHTCTILAGLRAGIDPTPHLPGVGQQEKEFYLHLFKTMDLIDETGSPQPDQIREFFEETRPGSLWAMWDGWRSSSQHDDLHLMPGLKKEGTWDSQPRNVRQTVLAVISQLPSQTWLSISSFVARLRQHQPDFLRSAGEYDSWYIKHEESGEYLRGFDHWEDVEGAYLRYLITGPLHWLGLVDLGKPGVETDLWTAFHISTRGEELLENNLQTFPRAGEEREIKIRSKGLLRVAPSVPRRVRYQVARFCDWGPPKKGDYVYLLSPQSLQRARQQGLEVSHLLTLLENHAQHVPPNIVRGLQRWDSKGTQAVMQEETILRVASPAVLDAIRNTRAERFLGEKLGATTVVIRKGSEEKIADVLVEMGFFAEYQRQVPQGASSNQEEK